MQKLKGDIEERILASAGNQFLRHGYSRASMRGIASAAGVSAGNLYNYFPNKDELFRRVVAPAITLLEEMLQKHHGQKGTDVRDMLSEQYRLRCMREYTALVSLHRRPMEILFFHAEGSSLENFLDRFTDYATDLTVDWFRHLDGVHPGTGPEAMWFTVHLHTVWMFSFLKELISHDLDEIQTRQALSDYVRFEIEGWKYFLTDNTVYEH